MGYLTDEQRTEILILRGSGDRKRSQQEVCDLFNEKYPNRQITQSTVSKIVQKFSTHGNVKNLPKSGRRNSLTDDIKINLALSIYENPHSSLNLLSRNNESHRSSIHRFFKKEKFHPYKVNYVQKIFDNDQVRRLNFCEQMMELCDQNPNLLEGILFTDEATFCLNGNVNKQNYRYWAPTNPHWILENNTQYRQKVNVWMGIINDRMLGPYFFQQTLTAERYLDFLTFELIPSLAVIFPNDHDPDIPGQQIWLQQDGAPPHYARAVREYLNTIFPNRWIGRSGAVEWPPRSPDLTPLDYFAWGYLKERVYQHQPQNIDDLIERIRQVTRNISPETVQHTVQHFYERLGYCQIVNGGHFEHLLKPNALFH